MYEFICSKRANTFGKLAYKDWIDFCAIDPLVFYNDYYGMIDANNDGKAWCQTKTPNSMLSTNQIQHLLTAKNRVFGLYLITFDTLGKAAKK